ncbi:MAG TPA: hypothetical protein VJU16_02855 [Planctomycetota bacterium]|nr:hypothetical protein [Planctomycetota bacterium]
MLAGCASKTVVEDPTIRSVPPQLVAETGASLYVLDAPDDWLEDNTDKLINPKPSPWMGVRALRHVLKYGLSHKQVRFVGHADFQPTSGYPTEVTLFNPDAEAHLKGDEMRRVGFRVRMKAVFSREPDCIDLEWAAEQLTDIPGTVGRDGKRGETRREVEKIGSGTGTYPLGAALFLRHPKWGDKVYILLLRIASLGQP